MSSLYQIGVRMTMDASQTTGILRMLAHEFIGLHHHIGHATMALGRFQQALVGASMAFIGTGLAKATIGMVDQGNELIKIQQQMQAAGWKNKEIQEATAKAWMLTGKHQSIGVSELLAMQKELAPVLGDRHHAVEMADQMAKLMVSFQGAFGMSSAAMFHTQVRDAIRAGELSANILKPERFAEYLDGMAKTLKAFGGTITPSDYFMATKYGRLGALNWSDEFTNTILPTIMQELGASSTGTALMTLYQAVVGGKMKAKSIAAFDDLGLIDHSKLDPENLTPEGRVKRLQPGAITGSRDLMANPFGWVWDTLIPALLTHGKITQEGVEAIKRGEIKGSGIGKETADIISEIVPILFGDRTASGLVGMLALQHKKILRDQRLIGDAYGLEQGVGFFQDNGYEMAKGAFHEQWTNLITALGSPGVGVATQALKAFNGALNGLAEAAAANPGAAKFTLTVMAGLATGLITLGAAMLTMAILGAAGPGVLLASLAVGIGAIVALNWPKVKEFGKSVKEWFLGRDEYVDEKGGFHARQKNAFDRLGDAGTQAGEWLNKKTGELASAAMKVASDIGTRLGQAIQSIPAMVAGAIVSMASAIGSKIASAISSIVGMIPGFGGGGTPSVPMNRGGRGQAIPQSYVPPAGGGGKAIQVRADLNIDGRRVAEATSYHIARGSRHVQSGAGYDPIRSPTPVDFQYI